MNLIEAKFADDDGNVLEINFYGSVRLLLKGKRPRKLGVVSTEDGVNWRWTKEEEESQIFRKNNSWSLPYVLVKNLGHFGSIKFITKERTYVIAVSKALEKGEFLWFKTQGIEKKIYVPIDEWDITEG